MSEGRAAGEAGGEHRAERRSGILPWLVAVALVLALSVGLILVRARGVAAERREREQSAASGPRVLVTRVQPARAARSVELPATIHGYVETAIYAKITGYLKEIRVDKGDRVREGQLLAVIDSPEVDKQVADAEADAAVKAQTDLRSRRVAKAGALSREEADVAHAESVRAQAVLERYRAIQAYERITAPFDGVVAARNVDPGALVTQAATTGTPILEMATLDPLRVYASVPQDVTPLIHDGDSATVAVSAYPQRTFTGKVTRHPDVLDAASRTMLVEVDLPNEDLSLRPGMYATIRFSVAQAKLPGVPDDTLVFRRDKVYVPEVRDGRIHLAEVKLGNDDGRTVEIVEGVKVGDVIAVNVGQGVEDGDPVQPVEAESEAPGAAGRSG